MKNWLQHFASLGQRGDSLVSVMIAAGLLSGTAVVGGGVMKLMRKDAAYTTVMSSAIAAESAIMQALQDPATYSNPAHTNSMRTVQGSQLQGMSISGDRGINGQRPTLATFGSAVRLNREGLPCSVGDPNPLSSTYCAITTNVDLSCAIASGVSTCKAAYQVAIDPAANANTPVPPFGSASWPPSASDYTTTISYDLFRRGGAKTACAPGELFITGLNKSNGNVTCARPADATLPVNGIPTAVTYGGSGFGHAMQLSPRTMGVAVCTDPKYALQVINGQNLDLQSGDPGQCIYRYKGEIDWMDTVPRGRDSINMNVCPDSDYTIVQSGGACQMEPLERKKGYRPMVCVDGTGANYACFEEPDPIIVEGQTYRIVQSPPPGADSNGSRISCRIEQFGSQPYGASWTGGVVWNQGKCRRYRDATMKAVKQ
ncbi:MAG: hypothetical protein EOO81_05720 [Oxalobacteraceae bacterium]|nr:MAG: hypothetical protein EOO81_05720 [Oxalobacteraceae bacterium]